MRSLLLYTVANAFKFAHHGSGGEWRDISSIYLLFKIIVIPPRNFPPGVLKLVELEGGNPIKTHAEYSNTTRNRARIQQMRNDLLMANSKLDLQIRENNA